MAHTDLMDNIPDREIPTPYTDPRRSTHERMGLRDGTCVYCGKAFEYRPSSYCYKVRSRGRELICCSYTCMRAKQREQDEEEEQRIRAKHARARIRAAERAKETERKRAEDKAQRVRKTIEDLTAIMDSVVWDMLTSDQKRRIRDRLRKNKKRMEDIQREKV